MTDAPLLSIVVPCYNEEGNIPTLCQRLKSAAAAFSPRGVEIVLVNDGSRDNTWSVMNALAQEDKSIVCINLSRNFGHQMALACGLDHARGERVLIIDADLQDPPELLTAMMDKMDEGYDVVYGKRKLRLGETIFKRLSAYWFYRLLNRLSEVPIPMDTGDFRLINRRALAALLSLPERVRFSRGLVSWLGFKQIGVEYVRDARFSGQTHYPLRAMLRLANDGLTSFSTTPLKLAVWLGALMMGVSVLLLGYVFISWLMFDTVRGWTSLMAIFLMFQSIHWFILGIIGNYLAVIFREIKGRPLYLVDSIINQKS